MSLRLSNLRLPIDEAEAALPARIARSLGVVVDELRHWRVLRKSLDTRDKQDVQFVYSVEVDVSDEEALLRQPHGGVQVERYAEAPFEMPPSGREPLVQRPIVVGSGPGGLAAAFFLAERGFRPLLLERGPAVNERIRAVKEFDAGGEFKPE